MEIWRDISGYEGRYQVSNYGRIKTVERYKSDGRHQAEIIRKTQIDRHGYEFALLFNGKKNCRHSVHVLVANAFIDNPENKPQVNHIDGDKLNNYVSNLEWCTASENQRHAVMTGLSRRYFGDDNWQTKVTDAQVIEIRAMRKAGAKLREICDQYGISETHASRIARSVRRFQPGCSIGR